MVELPWIYIASSFTYWLAAAALLYKGPLSYKYGLLLCVLMLFQPFFTYMADCDDIMCGSDTWCYYDRAWASLGVLTSALFGISNEFHRHGKTIYFAGIIVGLVFWFAGLCLYRMDGENHRYWIWAHTIWHFVPVLGGVIGIMMLKNI